MIRLKKNVNFETLEKYGFKKEMRYGYYNFWIRVAEDWNNQFQGINVYFKDYKNAYGKIIHTKGEVEMCPHANKMDGILDVLLNLIEKGIFERVK